MSKSAILAKYKKFELPRGKYQWEIVGYLRKNPG
jgi:hypothetical protein